MQDGFGRREKRGAEKQRTHASPRQSPIRHVGFLGIDLEPHIPAAVPICRRLATWYLGHVELQWALVDCNSSAL